MGIRTRLIAAALGAFVLLSGCAKDERIAVDLADRVDGATLRRTGRDQDNTILHFGFEPRGSLQEDARQYVSLLAYLSRATGYRFELCFLPKNGNIVDEVGQGRTDFAAVGAGTFLRLHDRHGAIPLVRGRNALEEAEYRSVIVVPTGSPIRKVGELRKKRFAFGGVNSTQGHLIPRIVLAEHGIGLGDLADYEYTGSHRNCAAAVASGRYDAGGLQDILGTELARKGIVRVLYTSSCYPSSGIVAGRAVPEEVRERVRRALLDFRPQGRDAAGLYHWDMTEMAGGFVPARESDYAELSRWARRFGLLDAPRDRAKP